MIFSDLYSKNVINFQSQSQWHFWFQTSNMSFSILTYNSYRIVILTSNFSSFGQYGKQIAINLYSILAISWTHNRFFILSKWIKYFIDRSDISFWFKLFNLNHASKFDETHRTETTPSFQQSLPQSKTNSFWNRNLQIESH